MKIFKHPLFHQWATSEGISDHLLFNAVDEMNQGLFDACLGSGLYKKRIAAKGRGKSGGYRTLIAFKQAQRAFFIYGFSKNVRGNISDHEEKIYRKLSKDFLGMDEVGIQKMISNGKLIEVSQHGQ